MKTLWALYHVLVCKPLWASVWASYYFRNIWDKPWEWTSVIEFRAIQVCVKISDKFDN